MRCTQVLTGIKVACKIIKMITVINFELMPIP